VFSSFEVLAVTVKSHDAKLAIHDIYRPPDSSAHAKPFSTFMSEFCSFLSLIATTPHEFLITGDFNVHINDPSDVHCVQFLTLLESFDLRQHVAGPTHTGNNTLNLVITSHQSNLLSAIGISPVSSSDHFRVISSLNFQPPPPKPAVRHNFRRIKSIDIHRFCNDIADSTLIINLPSSLPELVSCYNTTLSTILDKHAPVQSKLITSSHSNPWFTVELRTSSAIVAVVNVSGNPNPHLKPSVLSAKPQTCTIKLFWLQKALLL
jgi:hypothetical protein